MVQEVTAPSNSLIPLQQMVKEATAPSNSQPSPADGTAGHNTKKTHSHPPPTDGMRPQYHGTQTLSTPKTGTTGKIPWNFLTLHIQLLEQASDQGITHLQFYSQLL